MESQLLKAPKADSNSSGKYNAQVQDRTAALDLTPRHCRASWAAVEQTGNKPCEHLKSYF